jgi:hypothetical protein
VALAATSVGPVVALASPRLITKTEARALVDTLNLRHSDLPTYTQRSNVRTTQQNRIVARAARCIGYTDYGKELADARSPIFVDPVGPSFAVSSEVAVARSAALGVDDLAALRRPHALTCLESEVTSLLRLSLPKGDTMTASAGRLPSIVVGSDNVFALRITVVVHTRKLIAERVNFDEFGFVDGQVGVTVGGETQAGTPPIALERRLASLLIARTRAAVG